MGLMRFIIKHVLMKLGARSVGKYPEGNRRTESQYSLYEKTLKKLTFNRHLKRKEKAKREGKQLKKYWLSCQEGGYQLQMISCKSRTCSFIEQDLSISPTSLI